MSNRLSVETSPYLRQHADNPVDWYPWGEEALRRTREEEVAVAYHERTKHHFHRYAAALGYMDWATQPDPFRRYAGANFV